MKWTIPINQYAIIEAGFDFDLVDGAVFSMLSDYVGCMACPKKMEGNLLFFNVPYTKVIEEIPIAGLKTNDSVYRRLKKLEQFGVLAFHPENRKKKEVWFRWDRNYDLLVFKKQIGLQSDVNNSSVATSDLNPNQYGLQSDVSTDLNPTHTTTNNPILNPIPIQTSAAEKTAAVLPGNITVEAPLPEKPPSSGLPPKKSTLEADTDRVLTHLNEKGKFPRGLTLTSADNRRPIKKRLAQFPVEDLLLVVESKCREWVGTDMQRHLHPETLFNGHFEKYLNAALLPKTLTPNQPQTTVHHKSGAPTHYGGDPSKYTEKQAW